MKHALAIALVLGISALMLGCGGREIVSSDRQVEETTGGETTAEETTGGETTGPASIRETPELESATNRYQDYLVKQTSQLVDATRQFTDAVIAGDVQKAKELYVPARVYWERTEPAVERFAYFDPRIDARVNDVAEGEKWLGFHPIEQALWEKNTTKGQEQTARQLLADVKKLNTTVQKADFKPVDLIRGPVELLNEISGSKITGEEERYSRVDLYDMSANVAGSKAAYEALKPLLQKQDPSLVREIDRRFGDVEAVFESFRKNGEYVPYSQLGQEDTRTLSQAVDALAEPMSQVGKVL